MKHKRIEISKEKLISLLKEHPEWRFFKFDNEYEFNEKKLAFIWEGWDYYNDEEGKEVYPFDPKGKNKERLTWTHFTIRDKFTIECWRDCEWNLRETTSYKNGPFFWLQVLKNEDITKFL